MKAIDKLINHIIEIPLDNKITYLLLGISLFLPGFGLIYLSDTELFLKLDLFRLITLSIFYSSPLFLISFMFLLTDEETTLSQVKEKNGLAIIKSTALFSIIMFSLLLGFYFIFQELFASQTMEIRKFMYTLLSLIVFWEILGKEKDRSLKTLAPFRFFVLLIIIFILVNTTNIKPFIKSFFSTHIEASQQSHAEEILDKPE